METAGNNYDADVARRKFLDAYNLHARAFYDRCEREREALRPMRQGRPWNDHDALRATGRQSAWIACQASQAAAHLRGDGEQLSVATLRDDLQRRLDSAQRNYDAEPENGLLRIQYTAARETLGQLIAQLDAGELYQNFEYAVPVER